MNLCFDVDGPIIDVTDRYYRAYLESLKGSDPNNIKILTKEDYWNLKQKRVTDLEIGILSGLSINESKDSAELRRNLTFKHEYLDQDKLYDDVTMTFDHLKSQKITFYIVTLRRKKQLLYALKQFKLDKYLGTEKLFCIPDDHKFTNDLQEKYIMLVTSVNKQKLDPQDTWIIGDSDTDIHAGRLAKFGRIIAISRGIRSIEQLAALKPDATVSNLSEVISLINNPVLT